MSHIKRLKRTLSPLSIHVQVFTQWSEKETDNTLWAKGPSSAENPLCRGLPRQLGNMPSMLVNLSLKSYRNRFLQSSYFSVVQRCNNFVLLKWYKVLLGQDRNSRIKTQVPHCWKKPSKIKTMWLTDEQPLPFAGDDHIHWANQSLNELILHKFFSNNVKN